MSKANLAAKIKALRKRKGFSQEQLAEESTLSLRTIQRIENEETEPHGDSLRKLTLALGVTPDDVLESTPVEDKGFLTILHLSALAFLFYPILGILVPLAMWILKKDKIKMADEYGKKIINFQISWTLFIYAFIFVASKGRSLHFDISFKNILSVFLIKFSLLDFAVILIYLYNIVFIFMNVRRNKKGLKSKYITAIPFMK